EIAPPPGPRLYLRPGNKAVHFGFRDSMMPSGRGDGMQLPAVNPLLERGITDSEPHRSFFGFQGHGRDFIQYKLRKVYEFLRYTVTPDQVCFKSVLMPLAYFE